MHQQREDVARKSLANFLQFQHKAKLKIFNLNVHMTKFPDFQLLSNTVYFFSFQLLGGYIKPKKKQAASVNKTEAFLIHILAFHVRGQQHLTRRWTRACIPHQLEQTQLERKVQLSCPLFHLRLLLE